MAILILCLAACGEDTAEDSTAAEGPASSESTTESSTAEPTGEEPLAHDFAGMYVFTADEASAAALGEKYSPLPTYGVKFALVLTLGETEKAVLDLRISPLEEIEVALIECVIGESAQTRGMSYADFRAALVADLGSEEAMWDSYRSVVAQDLREIQANLIDAYPLSGTYHADGNTVTVTLGGSDLVFSLDGDDLVTTQNNCAMPFLRQG